VAAGAALLVAGAFVMVMGLAGVGRLPGGGNGLARLPGGAPPETRPIVSWVGADLAVVPDGTALVELEVMVDNPALWATESTSILWEPAFAQTFTLTESEPAPWRVRIDERGWGVLDTAGVLPQQRGTFRLRFSAPASPSSPLSGDRPLALSPFRSPRLQIVTDGGRTVTETSGDVRRAAPPVGSWLREFERGRLVPVADVMPPATAEARHVFLFAAGLAALFALLTGAAAAAAFRSAAVPAPARAGWDDR
jgi:hypothetical protein